MSGPLEITMTCDDGPMTPEKAMQIQRALIDLLNAVAGEGVVFTLTEFNWVDDGINEFTVRVSG